MQTVAVFAAQCTTARSEAVVCPGRGAIGSQIYSKTTGAQPVPFVCPAEGEKGV